MAERAYGHVRHEFGPIYDERSEILILGSFPSVRSRDQNFYYGNRQNRFWRVIAAIYGETAPEHGDVEGKKALLLQNGIAIWDVIAECDIAGSSDATIKNVVPADIKGLLGRTGIRTLFANGATAHSLYMKFVFPETGTEITKLPSTSPANAAYGFDRLAAEWSRALLRKD